MKTVEIEETLKKHFGIPENVDFYAKACNLDLYFGPRDIDENDKFEWKGFQHGIKIVSDWCDNTLAECWMDQDDGQIVHKEPEAEMVEGELVEPYWPSIMHFEVRDIKRFLFGKELASYL